MMSKAPPRMAERMAPRIATKTCLSVIDTARISRFYHRPQAAEKAVILRRTTLPFQNPGRVDEAPYFTRAFVDFGVRAAR